MEETVLNDRAILDETSRLLHNRQDNPNDSVTTQPWNRDLLRIIPILATGIYLIQTDDTYVTTNYETPMASEFKQGKNAVWILLASSIGGALVPTLTSLMEGRYGKHATILTATFIMTLGFFLCSWGFALWELSAAQFLVGTGGGGFMMMSNLILKSFSPDQRFAFWRGMFMSFGMASRMVGGLAWTTLMEHTSWRIPFGLEGLLAFMLCVLLCTLCRFAGHADPDSGLLVSPSRHSADQTVDLPVPPDRHPGLDFLNFGRRTLVVICVPIPLIALLLGGEVFPWTHPFIITLLAITLVLLLLLTYLEKHATNDPVFPARSALKPQILLLTFIRVMTIFSTVQVRRRRDTAFRKLIVRPPLTSAQIITRLAFYIQVQDLTKTSAPKWIIFSLCTGQACGEVAAGFLVTIFGEVRLLRTSLVLCTVLYLLLSSQSLNPAWFTIAFIGLSNGGSENCLTSFLLRSVREAGECNSGVGLGIRSSCAHFHRPSRTVRIDVPRFNVRERHRTDFRLCHLQINGQVLPAPKFW
jgi:MFS family permease